MGNEDTQLRQVVKHLYWEENQSKKSSKGTHGLKGQNFLLFRWEISEHEQTQVRKTFELGMLKIQEEEKKNELVESLKEWEGGHVLNRNNGIGCNQEEGHLYCWDWRERMGWAEGGETHSWEKWSELEFGKVPAQWLLSSPWWGSN